MVLSPCLAKYVPGGGYSGCFNGERAAGTPGLEFYFPCNEGSGNLIAGFSGVSGQESNLPSGWRWYKTGYFNRPAVKSSGSVSNYMELVGAEPQGKRSFQFLYYCDDPTENYNIFQYGMVVGGTPTTGVFSVSVDSGKLKVYAGGTSSAGSTSLQAGKWYLIQVNTSAVMIGVKAPPEDPVPIYALQIAVYLGGVLDATASQSDTSYAGLGNGVRFYGNEDDGFDEIRHLHRELFSEEITNYAVFLKAGRVPKKSAGKLGEGAW
ncbi:hypothetical protein GF359_09615 [candidate division WOR-3 bacterium]|uniref:Uncharacterized protein n=1 Tax=candidate division WOR-3 bacterium TaxID=2052148 RepID=A0A9D5QDW1_UNCW3|nr:hypothetical protein [candidate division WOR-3 bacterium]MBD3365456.1 hypothetical protein [candidate division WOR-3 bacterium]